MKDLSILKDEKKLELNNSGKVLLAKLVPLKDIKLQKEFQELFPLNPANVEKIRNRINESGYDKSQPVQIWNVGEKNILIDGHHRREAALQAGLFEIPCSFHDFISIEEALEYAISLQTERRNLSDSELLKALKVVDSLKSRGRGSDGAGKSAARSAELLGISTSRVEKTRMIDRYATEEIKQKIESGELSLNKAYLLVKSEKDSDSNVKNGKKLSKEVKKCLLSVKEFLENNDISSLKLFIENELSKDISKYS